MRMRTLLIPVAALTLALCLLAFAPSTRAAGGGQITGIVANGTHENAVVAGQSVTLQAAVGSKTSDVATTKTDALGRFTFIGLDTSGVSLYSVYTHFQNGLFATSPIQPSTDAAAKPEQLLVYDATTSDANLSITVATILLREPRPRNGLIGIGEFMTITNTGKTAFTGQATPINNDPHTLLRFAVPAGASNVTLGAGFTQAQVTPIATGFAATATIPPGQTQFAFAFDMPYSDTEFALTYSQVYKTTQAIVLAPTDMLVQARDFTSQGTVSAFDSTYKVYLVNNLPALKQANLAVVNLPQAGEQNYLDFRALVILAALLALIIGGLLFFYLRRGDLAPVLGIVAPVPAKGGNSDEAPVADAMGAERDEERRGLLRDLLTLERAHKAGKLDDATWHTRENEVKQHLRTLLANQMADGDTIAVSGASSSIVSATDEAVSLPEAQAASKRVETGGGR